MGVFGLRLDERILVICQIEMEIQESAVDYFTDIGADLEAMMKDQIDLYISMKNFRLEGLYALRRENVWIRQIPKIRNYLRFISSYPKVSLKKE